MTLTQILQKIRSAFYTKAETDATYLKDIAFNSYSRNLMLIKGDGTSSEFRVKHSDQAEYAQKDWNGNNITDTYSTKTELTNGLNSKANDSAVVHRSGNETIAGTKTFSDVTFLNKEIAYKDTKYDWTDTSLNTWCDAGHVSWSDKTGNRRMHELIGTKGGVWRKACYINENLYFNVDSNRNIAYSGTTFTWNNANILTDNNQIMVLKNLTGALIAPGAVIDCGTGNGLLAGWYIEPSGSWVLASNKITGKWKNVSIYNIENTHSAMFVKVG